MGAIQLFGDSLDMSINGWPCVRPAALCPLCCAHCAHPELRHRGQSERTRRRRADASSVRHLRIGMAFVLATKLLHPVENKVVR